MIIKFISTNYCNLCDCHFSSQKHMYFIKCMRQNSFENLIQCCQLFLTIKSDSMYSKKSAQFVDLNASTELQGVVSVK